MCPHAAAITPASWMADSFVRTIRRWPSPRLQRVGSRMTCFEACKAFTSHCGLRTRLDRLATRLLKAPTSLLPPLPLKLLRARTTVARRDFHPQDQTRLPRRTEPPAVRQRVMSPRGVTGFWVESRSDAVRSLQWGIRVAGLLRGCRGPSFYVVRFHSPLSEPDGRFSRIRLSIESFSHFRTQEVAAKSLQIHQPKLVV